MSDDEETMEIDSRDGEQADHAAAEEQLDREYPNRPHNHGKTLPFHSLFEDLFNPLIENRGKKPTAAMANRRKLGPDAHSSMSPSERRRAIIEKYISRWRRDVGDDFYPAFRLIIPEKDRERGVYGLKEKIIGKLLVKIMKIDKNSEDGFNLLNWKLPGQTSASRMAGDFAGRCYEVISKRPMRVKVGEMTIEEVNELLDRLSSAPREEIQLPVLAEFYKRMNAEELMWLIRVILRQMKVGATEKTFFHIWHPDAENLFNVSSNLRRVCWELYDPSTRLEGDEAGVTLMQCFQPQLAQFVTEPLKKVVQRLRPTDEDPEFWIEEKLDGERMQLHMISDKDVKGGKSFKFWSRKAKDYTYLYGNGFYDKNGALTQFLKDGFADGVENIILDGEMITWDPEQNAQVPFGTLKTAALSEQRNPFANGQRPLFRVFDILLLNDQPLTRYTLRDRRKALEASVKNVDQRFEIHDYKVGTSANDVEVRLREVVEQSSEGLVLKNPRGAYLLDDRSGDWQKVKPEYMVEFGESLDCLIIGAFYGSGHRGGNLSSFMCGLRAPNKNHSQSQSQRQTQSQSQSQSQPEGPSQRFISFFKVGGGMTANDYATIRHATDGKWHDWDARRPPTQYIDIGVGAGGQGQGQKEKPDVWIKPTDSLVVEVKAAQVTASDDYGCGMTLRFPRFKRLRRDKDWTTALSLDEFMDLRANVEKERGEKALQVDEERKNKRKARTATSRKKPLTVAGYNARDENKVTLPEGPQGNVFAGLTFYIMTESSLGGEYKKSKLELEALVKANGGKIVQTWTKGADGTICVAARRTVKVASLEKRGEKEIVTPRWVFDCIEQAQRDFSRGLVPNGQETVVPFEPKRHLFFIPEKMEDAWTHNVDDYGDSFARDTSVDELRECMDRMGDVATDDPDQNRDREEDIPKLFPDFLSMKALMFHGLVFFVDAPPTSPQPHQYDTSTATASSLARFAGATVLPSRDDGDDEDDTDARTNNLGDTPADVAATITHVIAHRGSDLAALRRTLARWSSTRRIPRIVRTEWILACWKEGTRVDEEMYLAR